MALARIISSSPLCSRELALNLLERGYAVEIVSPDAIPDNLADLELRVETGPADILTANVAARGETRSATLDFVHQLKSPSLEVKRPPIAAEALAVSDSTTSETIPALAISANPLPTTVQWEPIPVSTSALAPAIKPRIAEELDGAIVPLRKPVIVEKPEIIIARANAATDDPPKKPAAFGETPGLFVVPGGPVEDASTAPRPMKTGTETPAAPVFRVVIPKPSLLGLRIRRLELSSWRQVLSRSIGWVRRTALRPAGWLGWTALGFAAVMALGLALELVSVRMSHAPRRLGFEKTNPSVDGFSLFPSVADEKEDYGSQPPTNLFASGQSSVVRLVASPTPPPPKSRASSNAKPVRASSAAKPAKTTNKSKVVSHSEDLVAPDTITYFNRPGAKPVSVRQLARQRADSRKGAAGVLAANSSPAKSAAKKGSGN